MFKHLWQHYEGKMSEGDKYILTVLGPDPFRHEADWSVKAIIDPAPGRTYSPPKWFTDFGRTTDRGYITDRLAEEIVTFLGIQPGDGIEILSNDPEKPGDNHAHSWAERSLRISLATVLRR